MERCIETVLEGVFPRLISVQNFPYGLDEGSLHARGMSQWELYEGQARQVKSCT